MLPGLQQQGFLRLLIDGGLVDLGEALETLERSQRKETHVVVDRLVVKSDIRKRLIDSLELCGREGEGRVEVVLLTQSPHETQEMLKEQFPQVRWIEHPAGILVKFSERFECQLCHISYSEPEPRLFSFNNPFGACPDCQGFGNTMTLDLDLIIPDPNKSLEQGPIDPWNKPRYRTFQQRLLQFAAKRNIDLNTPWSDLPPESQEAIIKGSGGFPGIIGFFNHLEEKKYKMHVRIFISRYRGYTTCLTCRGERLCQAARDVVVAGKRLPEIARLTISEAAQFFREAGFSDHQVAVAGRILEEIRYRLDLLLRVGLDYLTLDRLSSSLSGGESQRIQLATSLGSTLVGALYVLDEPSIGLHPRDSQRLVEILKSLKRLGNTVLVVEHDAEIMSSADFLIDLGPRAGEYGGEVVFQGSYRDILQEPRSLTGRYLNGDLKINIPLFRRRGNGRQVELRGVQKHNLRNLDIRIPLGMFVCVTGVSGSGKSTLVHNILYRAVKRAKGERKDPADGYHSISGAENIVDAVLVDQSPIGRTPRSNPVTYVKAFDDIREIFAQTRDAHARNLRAGHFSFNLTGGRCETCQGSGTITVEMQFLADVELTCEDCKGTRFKAAVLEVRYKGKNIADVLELTVHEAIDLFAGNPRLVRKLKILEEVGLGYLRLGQSATALSGGEAQRIKLASFISRKAERNTLYIFDEPTTGLHFDDIRKLLNAFDKLMAAGNSVIVIEHNLDVIKTADWIIDLGPEGGAQGGRVVFEGSPDELQQCRGSYTGLFLKAHLERSGKSRPAARVS
jgi:excinuclease ABC subunit A